ncbi:MAG: molybdenum ABC transporter ATP-binding protein [Acetobacteraceae bacterium]|nr:molybdenum ABC transporter ATP-binding protein [Acetobacteraceae bacterium]
MSLDVAFRHAFPGVTLDVRLSAPTPGTVVLFGPSGCGKSTVVAVLAGLLRPAACRVAVDGDVLADTESGLFVPPEKRRIGVVFQDARLFPHLSVLRNLRYGLRRAPGGAFATEAVVDLLGIGRLLDRRPHTLSGGERQRVAIGRALLSQPRLLVMDEPLASLDAARKAEILPYLARLKTSFNLPILYVTHAPDEVARLADTLVLIREGRVIASGPLSELAARADSPLAAQADAAAVLPARVVRHHPERALTALEAGGRVLLVPLLPAPEGERLRVRIPAREIVVALEKPAGISIQNIIPGTVHGVVEDRAAHAALVEIVLDDGHLLARVTADAARALALAPGRPVLALIKSVGIEVLA